MRDTHERLRLILGLPQKNIKSTNGIDPRTGVKWEQYLDSSANAILFFAAFWLEFKRNEGGEPGTVSPDNNMNQLFYGDNLEVLQKYIDNESVDLCYVDPPFNSKRNYNQIYNNVGTDDIAQTQAFVDTWSWGLSAELQLDLLRKDQRYTRRLVDTILGFEKILGKGAMLSYLVNMAVRIEEIWRVLKPTGSFYLHCDYTASHYLKIILDAVFCDRGGDFRNEIIWHYYNKMHDRRKKLFPKATDTILFYVKDVNASFTYHQLKEMRPTPVKQLARKKVDGVMKNARDADGNLIYRIKEDKTLDNVWSIPCLQPAAAERLGYATQKPLALLERIIKASSNEGDVILDAFCGCGTTVDAAHSLNRKWIGIDITYNAVSLILKRLKDRYSNDIERQIQLFGIPRDMESATALAHKKDDRLRKEFEKWAILTYTDNHAKINDKKGSDRGMDGIAYIWGGSAIFSVKSGNVSVKDIRDLRGVMDREEATAGVLLTLEEPTKPMLQEAAALGHVDDLPSVKMPKKTPKLQIVTIQEMLDGARMTLPLPEAVVKSAGRHKPKNKNQQIDFEE
ncbi:MAG: restriction endonuclease [Planctomycetaceae bacterium]|nr:restriction endonuclease [Planctomycetaceae bacterium]